MLLTASSVASISLPAMEAQPSSSAVSATGLTPDRFRWESDMTALVANEMSRLLPRARTPHMVVAEVPAAVGVADLVAVCFDAAAVRHRLAAGLGPVLSPLRVQALCLIRQDRPTTAATLARKLGTNPKALTRSTLGPLVELGAVEQSGQGLRATGAWRPVGSQLTSVELKLSKWRDALRQADNFAFSADRSWVVLDQARAGAALASLDHFRLHGVGLAVLSVTGRLRVITPPRGRRPERWLRALMAESAWSVAEAETSALVLAGS